jgi:hypothetical protein
MRLDLRVEQRQDVRVVQRAHDVDLVLYRALMLLLVDQDALQRVVFGREVGDFAREVDVREAALAEHLDDRERLVLHDDLLGQRRERQADLFARVHDRAPDALRRERGDGKSGR